MNLAELSTWLSSTIGAAGADTHDRLRTALAPFCSSDTASDLLNAALDDDQWMDAMARASYRHPNGFDKIVLLSTDAFQLRLHVWGQDRPEAESENIHNHRWDFSSVILLGGYRYQEFTADGGTSQFYVYTYNSRRGVPSYSLEPLGRRGLSCCFDAHLRAGTSYTLSSEVFHRVATPPGRLTASLVLQGPHRPTSVLVFAKKKLR
ncbi:MAG: hypothetical protein IRY90_19885, partial [Actinomadura rubrobrunea]|nr:hypothetical protein [Actinomadura rubrobrunea]